VLVGDGKAKQGHRPRFPRPRGRRKGLEDRCKSLLVPFGQGAGEGRHLYNGAGNRRCHPGCLDKVVTNEGGPGRIDDGDQGGVAFRYFPDGRTSFSLAPKTKSSHRGNWWESGLTE
jgi:hypothetical protein